MGKSLMTEATVFSVSSKISIMEMADVITVDTEGMGKVLGMAICFDGLMEGFYLPFDHEGDNNLSASEQKKVLSILDSREALVMYNAMHDLRELRRVGLDYRGVFYDPMLMAHWINEERMSYELDRIAPIYGFPGKNMSPLMKFIIDTEGWNKVPVALMDVYSSNDAFITHGAFRKIQAQFEKEFPPELWALEQEFLRDVIMPMKERGIRIDTHFCVREYMKGLGAMDECKAELKINPGSTKDLKKLLIDEMGLPVKKLTPKGAPSFDKDAMAEYDIILERKKDPRAQTILRYRGWQKTTSANYRAYMDLCDADGVLHPGYMLHRARTHRLACEKPALHQIPKSSNKEWNGHLKRAFIPREGFRLWGVDYSQLQFRMAVAYANQEDLIDIFNDETRDIFTEMAAEMGWLRSDVKTLVYLILFGGGATRASDAFGLNNVEQGRELVDEFHNKYPRIRDIANECAKVAKKFQSIKYWTGQKRHFYPYFKDGRKHPPKYYRAFNAAIQGGEAEIVKRAMVRLQREVCDANCYMLLQIHDEVVFEIREGMENGYLPQIKEVMESVPEEFCSVIGNHVTFKVSASEWGSK